jgi:hypothetical protein
VISGRFPDLILWKSAFPKKQMGPMGKVKINVLDLND